jgi:hypothetical protein
LFFAKPVTPISFARMITKKYYLIICLLLLSLNPGILAQSIFPVPNYPQGYFRNPLGISMDLSGNFGELRPNHYHMGLDLKTQKRQNLPVYAAADGYIARIKIEPFGFGRAIYINHPNGYSTLYAHLNDFFPALDEYVKQQQYKQESWKVLLELPPNLFPIKKGEFLAYSGNTGGSQAPHLHWELRRTAGETNLNPLLFGMPLADYTNPTITRLAVYDRTKSIYEQSPRYITITKTASGYTTTPATIVVNTPKVSFAIGTSDTHSGSTNPNGVCEAVVYDNGAAVAGFLMDNISYNSTRGLNAHIDYKTKASGGPYLQQIFELPGYINSIYKHGSSDGVVNIGDGNVHAIKIMVKDANGNTTVLNSNIQYAGQPFTEATNGKQFYPLMLDGFETERCEFYIGERCLYDSVHIGYRALPNTPMSVSETHVIGATYIPLHEGMLVRIKPTRALTKQEMDRVVMQRFVFNKKDNDVLKVEWQNGWAGARFREFGNFQLLIDTTPPVITPIGIKEGANLASAARIIFRVSDNLESFYGFRAELDGKWLCFSNDKGRSFVYKIDDKCTAGPHQLKVSVKDEAGNTTEQVYNFVVL